MKWPSARVPVNGTRRQGRALSAAFFCAMLFSCSGVSSAESARESGGLSTASNSTAASPTHEKPIRTIEMTPTSLPSTGSSPPAVIISDLSDYADDNIAILMLLRSGRFDVRGLITTSGNVCAERAAAEGHRFLLAAGRGSVPLVRGFPLSWHEQRLSHYRDVEKPTRSPSSFVGALGDGASCSSADTGAAAAQIDPADFLIEQARGADGGLTILLLGPATILAEAIRRDRSFADLVREVLAMAGAIEVPGNVTRYAEFNVWFDPEAFASVIASHIPVTLVPLDAAETVTYAPRRSLPKRASADFAGSYLAAYLERREAKRSPVPMWDEVVAAVAIDPDLIERAEDIFIDVSTSKDEHYGQILSSPTASGNASRPVRVVTRVRADGVRTLVERLLAGGD